MTYKELQYACPIIMNSIHLFPSRKEAFLQQAQFFKNHTFIFNALTPKEANILRLRYGIDDGKILNCQQISELIDVSRARVSQLENRAIAKLRKMKNLFLINKYTDDTFDGSVEDLVEHKKISLIRQDILRTIDDGTLKIINNVSILKLNIDYGRNAKELRDMKISLMNKGIYSCADFVEKVREFDSILQFVTHMQITYTVYNAIMESICNLIEKGDIQITSIENLEVYNKHVEEYKKEQKEKKVIAQRKIREIRQQDKINEAKRKDRLRDGARNPEDLLIEDLNLSPRAYTRLKAVGINTMQDLIDNKGEFIYIRGMGKKSIDEILIAAGDLGIYLKPASNYKYAY